MVVRRVEAEWDVGSVGEVGIQIVSSSCRNKDTRISGNVYNCERVGVGATSPLEDLVQCYELERIGALTNDGVYTSDLKPEICFPSWPGGGDERRGPLRR